MAQSDRTAEVDGRLLAIRIETALSLYAESTSSIARKELLRRICHCLEAFALNSESIETLLKAKSPNLYSTNVHRHAANLNASAVNLLLELKDDIKTFNQNDANSLIPLSEIDLFDDLPLQRYLGKFGSVNAGLQVVVQVLKTAQCLSEYSHAPTMTYSAETLVRCQIVRSRHALVDYVHAHQVLDSLMATAERNGSVDDYLRLNTLDDWAQKNSSDRLESFWQTSTGILDQCLREWTKLSGDAREIFLKFMMDSEQPNLSQAMELLDLDGKSKEINDRARTPSSGVQSENSSNKNSKKARHDGISGLIKPTASGTSCFAPPQPGCAPSLFNKFAERTYSQLGSDNYPADSVMDRMNHEWQTLSEEERNLWNKRRKAQILEFNARVYNAKDCVSPGAESSATGNETTQSKQQNEPKSCLKTKKSVTFSLPYQSTPKMTAYPTFSVIHTKGNTGQYKTQHSDEKKPKGNIDVAKKDAPQTQAATIFEAIDHDLFTRVFPAYHELVRSMSVDHRDPKAQQDVQRLTESILREIILKADAVELSSGDSQNRKTRKRLIDQAEQLCSSLESYLLVDLKPDHETCCAEMTMESSQPENGKSVNQCGSDSECHTSRTGQDSDVCSQSNQEGRRTRKSSPSHPSHTSDLQRETRFNCAHDREKPPKDSGHKTPYQFLDKEPRNRSTDRTCFSTRISQQDPISYYYRFLDNIPPDENINHAWEKLMGQLCPGNVYERGRDAYRRQNGIYAYYVKDKSCQPKQLLMRSESELPKGLKEFGHGEGKHGKRTWTFHSSDPNLRKEGRVRAVSSANEGPVKLYVVEKVSSKLTMRNRRKSRA